ncbi:MAG: protein-L-isoaspartate(D-aspartate) O-methyltransferase [Fidelibacterota bacterium]|nr:MAG: protein-L-isoaspartate(D-aspartate) O-methyltransferase [Candidatus Neomarinimicrobiota bacterium]
MRRKDDLEAIRQRMVAEQIRGRGIRDERILAAMATIPRHHFVPYTKPRDVYRDGPLPIGQGQTISQPYITAYMTDLLQLREASRVLEIGTGSGYQAALLSFLCTDVYTIEIIRAHYIRARKIIERLKYKNIHFREGNGREGWPEEAPFDGIVVTAAAKGKVPVALLNQLNDGGRMVIPIGQSLYDQQLVVYTRKKDRLIEKEDLAVRFVPLVEGSSTSQHVEK